MSTQPRQLRPYQIEAVNAVYGAWTRGERTCVVLPTGTGKSTVIAQIAVNAFRSGARVLLLAHRRELLDQMVASIYQVAPDLLEGTVGFVQAERDQPDAPIVAGSFQTLASPARLKAVGERHVVITDEVHHSAADTYAEVLAQFPDAFKAGFTATLQRSDGGLGDLWDSIAFERSLKWALEQGYLVTPQGKTVVIPELDTTSIKIRNGDYAAGELSAAMMVSVESCVEAIHTHAGNRRMLIFGAGVEHCEALADALSTSGIPTAVVVGSTTSEDRRDLFDDFTAGRIQALVTVQVLTEGTDLPACDCVVLARPTRSPVLFTQMVGRALRLHRDKTDALVLDLAGATRDVSMVTLSSLVEGAQTQRVSPSGDEDPGQAEPAPAPARVQRVGAIDMTDVDLLTASNAVWLSTRLPAQPELDGVSFLDGQNGWYAYLLPAGADQYAVGIVPGTNQRSYLLADGAAGTRDQAREAAEHEINRYAVLPLKTAGWRSRPTPSDGQVTFGQTLGISGAEQMSKPRLSDEISTVLASRQLRKFFR